MNSSGNIKSTGQDNYAYPHKHVGHFFVILAVLVVYQILSAWPVFDGLEWYMELNKPAITPIPWLMRLIWFLALTSLAASIYSCLDVELRDLKLKAFFTLLTQLSLNILWTMVFFWGRSLYLGLSVGVFSFGSACLYFVYTFRMRPIAGLLLVPYLGLLAFDNLLMIMLYILN